MAYTLYNSDGTIIAIIADGTVDQHSTSLALVGKNLTSYGEYINENFIKLLSTGASTEEDRTLNPLLGQQWYDSVNSQLKIYDNSLNGWRNVIGAEINPALPSTLGIGDFWFDQYNKQLKIKLNASTSTWVIGPAFSATIGDNGWVLPEIEIIDNNGNPQNITLLKNYGKTIGAISSAPFNISSSTSQAYFGTSTISTVVAGLNVVGDISYSGTVIEKYLSFSVELADLLVPQITTARDFGNIVTYQNPAIAEMLMMAFPPVNANVIPFDLIVDEPGLPVGTEARVVCHCNASISQVYSFVNSQYIGAHQIRRFRIVYDPAIQQNRWDAVNVYAIPGSTVLTNILPEPNALSPTVIPNPDLGTVGTIKASYTYQYLTDGSPAYSITWTNMPGA